MCLSPTGNDSEVKCIQYWSCRHNLCETVDPNQTQNSLNTESYLWISSIVAFKKRDNLHYSINTNIKINEVKFTHQADLCGLCLLHAWVFYSIWGFTKNLFNFKFLEFRQILKKIHIFRSSKSLPKITFFFLYDINIILITKIGPYNLTNLNSFKKILNKNIMKRKNTSHMSYFLHLISGQMQHVCSTGIFL